MPPLSRPAAALATALALLSTAPAQAGAAALQTLSGAWASPAPEPWYCGYGTREFAFHDGRWSLTFTHALDPEMTLKTFRFRTLGAYRIGAPAAIPGAYHAVFQEAEKHLTRLTDDPALTAALGLAPCDLALGVEADISATGCAAWRPVAECGEDHDLIALLPDGALRFGQRPADDDMCTADKAPTALFDPAVRRID